MVEASAIIRRMGLLQAEENFFQETAQKIRELVLSFGSNASVSVQKRYGDYATEVDIAVENLIVKEIKKCFVDDEILAEEGYSDTQVSDGRIWIIDPICGTTNIGRGMKNFCTNIALADKKQIIASCVIDHSTGDVIWSIGDGKIFVNDRLFEYIRPSADFGVVVDLDFGSLGGFKNAKRAYFADAVRYLLNNTKYMVTSLNTSLGFAYTAIGKIDGFINSYNHPWDICAASFLLQQSGGVITALDGGPWTIESVGAIGARQPEVHKVLLNAYREENSVS